MQTRKRLFRFVGIGIFFVYFLLYPQESVRAVRDGMQLCIERLIPALFPYLVLSNLFLASGGAQAIGRRCGRWMRRVFLVGSGGATALILGLTGGYPLGAKTAAALCKEGTVQKNEAEKLLQFCNNSGPAFVFGVVGAGCYGSTAVGAVLFGAHVLAALLSGVLLRGEGGSDRCLPSKRPLPPFSEALIRSVSDAGHTLFMISLLVTAFGILTAMIRQLFSANETVQVLLIGFLEVSSGCFCVAHSALPWAVKLPLTAAVIGWGGVCVHLQTLSAAGDAGLSIRPYLRAKALHAVLSALLVLPFSPLLAKCEQTFSSGVTLQTLSPMPWSLFSCGMICLIFLQLTTSISEEKGL